jgi:hypothetical protein
MILLATIVAAGTIAIDQMQLAQCIFQRHSKHSDRVRPKGFVLMLVGGQNRHLARLNTRAPCWQQAAS